MADLQGNKDYSCWLCVMNAQLRVTNARVNEIENTVKALQQFINDNILPHDDLTSTPVVLLLSSPLILHLHWSLKKKTLALELPKTSNRIITARK